MVGMPEPVTNPLDHSSCSVSLERCAKLYSFSAVALFSSACCSEILLKAQIATNAESGTRKQYHFSDDADVLDLARRAYAAMPYIPLQGVDIVRHAASGRLFVLEINAGGNTWHFSSLYMEQRRKSRPREEQSPQITREERIAQFGAWDVAARVLIKKTQEEAR